MASKKLTPVQAAALDRVRQEGRLYAYDGVSAATIRVLERAGLINVTWTSHHWTNYRTCRTHHLRDWAATPAHPRQER
ncbi:hypothetical protein ACFVH6_21745 [Spirillospora sp. NPDC127200]